MIADKEDLHVLTDSDIHHALLSAKLERAHKKAIGLSRAPTQKGVEEKLVHQLITATFFDAIIPANVLANVDLVAIVDVRQQLQPELQAFREHVWSLQTAITTSQFDSDTEKTVRELVDSQAATRLTHLPPIGPVAFTKSGEIPSATISLHERFIRLDIPYW